jgi:hypothetical protein
MQEGPQINPDLAVDLSRAKDERLAADLSKAGIKARKRQLRLVEARRWAYDMKRTFKGIRGRRTRAEYIRIAIMNDPVLSAEIEND